MESMQHLNGNLLCAVDVETTGNEVGYHEILQICVLPLSGKIEPFPHILPFYCEIKPSFPERVDYDAISISKLEVMEILIRAFDHFKVSEMFEEWFQNLGLAYNKKIVPLAHNWPYDLPFIKDWLGNQAFNDFFHFHYRDPMCAALYLNDRNDHHAEVVPFPKVSLRYITSQLRIQHIRAHDALGDCLATAEAYKKMLRYVEYLTTPDKISKMLKPFANPFESADECLARLLADPNIIINAKVTKTSAENL